ncbi:MAG: metal ABC transporter ATP-binding protein [Lachnospiraceae bacterium]|nr:metal ABC transporter ATP-binding protein [Lachnospiraceae bacterium]
MALIECNNTTFGYSGEIVLRDINFELKGGEYLCIVGENGAGKSTLIKGLLKLITPIEGKVLFGDGLDANEIGYLPQQTMIQKNFPASVIEVVMSGCINRMGLRPWYSKNDKRIAREKLSLMGMAEYEKRCYQELSGGQQQRVLLARALCAAKKVLLLDEPVSGLDPVATAELYDLIKTINEKMDMTIIMVSHDIHAAMEYATHILHLSHTQLFFGSKGEYISSKAGKDFISVGESSHLYG